MIHAKASAPGKIILLGEHAVVYGQPALAAPIDKKLEVAVWADFGPGESAPANAEPLADEPFHEVFAALSVRGAFYASNSEVPRSSGFGTSAAFGAAAIRALAAARKLPMGALKLWELTTGVERHYHGSSSGLDPAAVLADGPILFRKGSPPSIQPIPLPARWTLLVCVVSPRPPTRTLVEALGHRSAANPQRFNQLFAEIGTLVGEGGRAMERNDSRAFGELMNANQRLLNEAGISSPELDAWCSRAMDAGALGAKLTGAGGGGTAIALTTEPDRLAERLAMPTTTWFTAGLGNST